MDAYTFPVTMMVVMSNGTVVKASNANTLLDGEADKLPVLLVFSFLVCYYPLLLNRKV